MARELEKVLKRQSHSPAFPYMPKDEWDGRIRKARGLMAKQGMDALMILNSQDRLYFYGATKTYRHLYPVVGIIPANGPVTAVLESADSLVLHEEGYADLNIGYRGDTQAPTATAPDPIKLIIEVFQDLSLEGKTIGMEFGRGMWWDGLNVNEWEQIKQALPTTRFIDATALIWDMRTIKSPWEVGVMRHLHKLTAKGYFEIINKAAPGKNERELFYEALNFWIKEGLIESANYTLNCINAIRPFRDRPLKHGDWIMLDGGPTYKGYCADIQRFIQIGDLGPDFVKASNLACEGMWAAEEILKPGVTAGQLWTAAYGKMAEQKPEAWRTARSRTMVGWIGHGEGLNIHEPPYLVEGSEEVIREGMIIAIEVPSYFNKTFANMPEDSYLVTANGFERLSSDLGPIGSYIKT